MMTTPDHAMQGMRNFYVQPFKAGDIPNFRGMIKTSLMLARLETLDVNDPEFIQIKNSMELLTGYQIQDVADFISAIQATSKNRSFYALPPIVKVAINAIIQAARLAVRMSEQSA